MHRILSPLLLLCVCVTSGVGATGAAEPGGYLFATFRGESSPMTEQVYLLLSQNGHDWEALNQADPVLVSTVGERGARDPFLLRSHDQQKVYVLATDLSIHSNGDWARAQTAASRSILIWETEDLVRWTGPRRVEVAPPNAGCAWAPEAVYDSQRGDYLVFWASKTAEDNFRKHRIWAARTKDFTTFSEPFIYIDKPTTVIDTTIVRDGDTYHRFTKDERSKAITMETSSRLADGWREVEGFSLSGLVGYEGPACFRIEPRQPGGRVGWRLLLDRYSTGDGYQSYETDNLASGRFVEGAPMNFPFHPVRHGSVLPISGEEFARLRAGRSAQSAVGP